MYMFIQCLWKDGHETDGTVSSGEAGRAAFSVCPLERYTFYERITYPKQFLGTPFTRGLPGSPVDKTSPSNASAEVQIQSLVGS